MNRLKFTNACSLLGLEPNNFKAKLKKNYRVLAKKYHPDTGGDELKFKQITSAYTLLSKVKIVPKEDTTRNQRNPFGNKRTARTEQNSTPVPKDAIVTINVSVKELHDGLNQVVHYTRKKACAVCLGAACSICAGELSTQKLSVDLYIHSTLMNSDNEIIYKGLGDSTYEDADLILKLNVATKSIFKLEYRKDKAYPVVVSTVLITKDSEEVVIPTLDDNVKVKIPKDNNGTLRLKEKGLMFTTTKGDFRGDHYVRLKIK